MPTVYIETSIIGYLTARSRDVVVFQARQELTRDWWHSRRQDYELVTSHHVVEEAAAGDANAAAERLQYLEGIPLLDATDPEIEIIVDALLAAHLLPAKASADAEHIATATVHGIEYLLTWNCRHIANAATLPAVYQLLFDLGHVPPLIVTPEEFTENV